MTGRRAMGPSIFLLSGAALAYEVLLVRLLAMTRFHHLAFMVLSLALLAYGASGVLLAHRHRWLLRNFEARFSQLAALFAVGSVVCFHLSQRIPVTPTLWVWAPGETVHLACLYLLLALPLLAAATAVGLAYCRPGAAAARVYRADLWGAAAGSLAALSALWLPGTRGLWLCWAAGLSAAALMAAPTRRAAAAGLLLLALLGPLLAAGPSATLTLSAEKPLAMALEAVGAQQMADVVTPIGRLTVTRNPTAPYRQAPGLSLTFQGEVSAQWALFTDGEGFDPLPPAQEEGRDGFRHLDHQPEALAYVLAKRRRVLVLGAPVTDALALALRKGAVRVTVVATNPGWQSLATHPRLTGVGRLFAAPGVRLAIASPRGFLRDRGAHDGGGHDLIVLGTPDPSALKPAYTFTVEALGEALEKLAPGGTLSVSGPSDLPPRVAPRLLNTAAAALKERGVGAPGDHMILIRSLRSVHLLVGKNPIPPAQIAVAKDFCRRLRFDPVWFPGMGPDEANRWNRLAGPVFHTSVRRLLGPEAAAFLEDYKFDLSPVTDDRPYFSRFIKPATLMELFSLKASGGLAMLSPAEPVLAATLAQASILAVLLIWLPLRPFRLRPPPGAALAELPPGSLYFLLGAGFMLAEFAVLERMTRFLSAPVLAVAVTLAAFLALAGLGGGLSARLPTGGRPPLAIVCGLLLALCGLLLLYLAGLPAVLSAWMGIGIGLRLVAAPLLIAPLAIAMGLPFPLAIAALQRKHPQAIPWAWGLNGCGALMGPVVGMVLAVYLGIGAVLLAAVACYGLAAAVLLWRRIGARGR